MNTLRSIVVSATLLALPAEAQVHRFETDPVVTLRENFVACDVLSQLQRVMDNPRFLLTGECEPLSAGRRVRIYATRWPRRLTPSRRRQLSPIAREGVRPVSTLLYAMAGGQARVSKAAERSAKTSQASRGLP
jgi:hypothetical protein